MQVPLSTIYRPDRKFIMVEVGSGHIENWASNYVRITYVLFGAPLFTL
jgi:hypothetical protein